MEFYKDCPDDVLIEVFKNLDLKSRLQANQTCKRWNELLNDPRANLENVSCITLEKCKFTKELFKKLLNDSLSDVIKNMMNGLSDHIGKVKEFWLDEDDVTILSRINEIINGGGLKIDRFYLITSVRRNDSFYSIFETLNAIMPSSVRELSLNTGFDNNAALGGFRYLANPVLACDWSRLSQLRRLSLSGLINLPTILLPALKCLSITISLGDRNQPQMLNTRLTFLPNLEELRLSCLRFESNTFSDFLSTIKNKLSNLRRLQFDDVSFNLSNIKAMFYGSFFIDTLKEIEFKRCSGDWIEAPRLFIRICALDIFRLDTKRETRTDYFHIYKLAASINRNTKLELSIDTALNYKSGECRTPTEFGQTLTKLSVEDSLNCIRVGGTTEHLRDFFNYNLYENLTDIRFSCRGGVDDDKLKRIAQSCLRLETLHILDGTYKCNISEKGLKSFLIYWDDRRSKRLSITLKIFGCVKIDGLFGTSDAQDHGILDEHWSREDDKNGPSVSEPEKTVANDKRWMIFRKTFLIDKFIHQKCTRLVIWDSAVSIHQKMLVIKDYNKDKLDISLRVKTI